MSCNVDVDVYFEELDGIYLQLVGIDTRSFSDQMIDSIISVDIELRKLLLNRRMLTDGGRT